MVDYEHKSLEDLTRMHKFLNHAVRVQRAKKLYEDSNVAVYSIFGPVLTVIEELDNKNLKKYQFAGLNKEIDRFVDMVENGCYLKQKTDWDILMQSRTPREIERHKQFL